MTSRWKRWALGAAAALAAYAALGFWAVPQLIRHQVPRFGQAELARQASIGEVSFNPFTLRLEAADLRLAETDGMPLFAIGGLAVELQWRSLWRRAWSFAQIRISAPAAHLAIAADGTFNLAQLLATLDRRPKEASTGTGLPRLVVEQLALQQGRVEVRDQRAGYANVLSPIEFSLSNFSTLPDQSDEYTLVAESARGGRLRWKGTASMNPIRGSGELTLDHVSLPELGVYLRSYTRLTVAAGQMSAALPYTFSYGEGGLEARLAGARLSLRDLALAREGVTESFASLTQVEVSGVNADLARREAMVGEVRADGGKLAVRRDARGELDLAGLMIAAAGRAPTPATATATALVPAVVVNDWKLAVKQLVLDQVAITAEDETVQPPLRLNADKVGLQLQLSAAQVGANLQLQVANAAMSVAGLALASGTQTLVTLAQMGFTGGTADLATRRAGIERLQAQDGQLQLVRDRAGRINIVDLLPRFAQSGVSPAAPAGQPWVALFKTVELAKIDADVTDQGTGVKVHVNDLTVKMAGASSDLKQPVKFSAGLRLREGGQLSAQGSVVPARGAAQADLRVSQVALAPLQPLLAQYLKLKIASGHFSAAGKLATGAGTQKNPRLRYVGGFEVTGLALNEEDGDQFTAWKSLGTDQLTASLGPGLIDVPELRVVEANAKLIIENDRSFNAARLLVRPSGADAKAAAPSAAAPQPADDPFPVRIRRVRLQDAKLDFTDLSLRPQFGAKIYELNGTINGLSSSPESRSQVELDGRVDEAGLARIRGELNPFAPANNTDLNVVFKNVDMVSASPYTMKFAGYRIAQGKISLDLQYRLRNSQLEGANQIIIDKLTLGERVDSPDALKLPLELAIAILKDSDGRIELGLPVTGNINDPQFSYGAIIWKAIGSVLARIVTAPFRALGSLLGVSGDKLEAIDFDPGSDRLLPPEREKLRQVALILGKRAQLKLSVPGSYSELADGAALRARAVRAEIARRAGIRVQPGEEPGPVDLADGGVRKALRELYAERFGGTALDQQKKAAEGAAGAPDPKAGPAPVTLPLWQRVSKMVQGEPLLADATAFYNGLLERLNQSQPLASDALARLGTNRAEAVLAALKEAGVDPTRATAIASGKIDAEAGKPVALKLVLAAR